MKDASRTDVIVHRGTALTSFYQCGDLYRARPDVGRDPRQGDVERPVPLRLGRLGAPEGRRPHRRAALLQLQQGGAVHALRRRRRGRRPRPLHRRPAARAAAAARHGLHRELRRPQRLPALLGARGARQGRPRRALPPRHAEPLRRHPAARADERHPVVRGRPDLRPALRQRVRGRRRDRPRRLLPGRPGAAGQRHGQPVGAGLPLPRPRPHAGAPAPLAAQPAHRPRQGGAALRQHHRVRHDERRVRRRDVPLRLRRDGQARLVPLRRPRQARPPDGHRGALLPSATTSSAARPRWRRASAAPARTTATS